MLTHIFSLKNTTTNKTKQEQNHFLFTKEIQEKTSQLEILLITGILQIGIHTAYLPHTTPPFTLQPFMRLLTNHNIAIPAAACEAIARWQGHTSSELAKELSFHNLFF